MSRRKTRLMEPLSHFDTGVLYREDNLARLRKLPDDSIDLIYLDPPFFSNRRYEVMGITRFWRFSEEKMAELIAEGRVVQTKPGSVPRQKRYLDEMPGVPLQDVWTDVQPVPSRGAERLGYPTQKPEALLERIIASSSDRGQVVLDPFCGCGTTIAVAQRMRREWIGIDISPQAVGIMKRRVDSLGADATVEGLPRTLADLKQLGPYEFQNWIIQRVHGVHAATKSGDMGIDGWSFFERLPIQVKQSERVGRNVVDNFETAIERSGKHKGYLVAFSFSKGAVDEAARSKEVAKNAVVLVKVEDLLRVAELVEAAELSKQPLDLSGEAPDLMALFVKPQKEILEPGEFPLPSAPDRSAKRDAKQLEKSVRESASRSAV